MLAATRGVGWGVAALPGRSETLALSWHRRQQPWGSRPRSPSAKDGSNSLTKLADPAQGQILCKHNVSVNSCFVLAMELYLL